MLLDTNSEQDNLKLQRSLTMLEPPTKKNLMRGLLGQLSNVSNGDESRRVIPFSPNNDAVLTSLFDQKPAQKKQHLPDVIRNLTIAPVSLD